MRNYTGFIVLTLGLVSGCQQRNITPQLAETRLQLAMEWMARGELKVAESHLNAAAQRFPHDYRVMLAQARYYQLCENQAKATAIYSNVLKIAADNGYVLNNYGAFLCSLGQYDRAHQQFRAAAQSLQSGARADSYDNAGYCYLKAHRTSEANVAFAEAIKADAEKGTLMLAEAGHRFARGEYAQARLLLDIYQRQAPATAESLWLEIRFAALAERSSDLKRHAAQLAQHFPQSLQYQQFLANEY